MAYDHLLKEVGEFGVFQKRMCFFIFCSTFTCALGTLTMIFTLHVPEHRCFVSGIDDNLTYFDNVEALLAIPNITKDGKITRDQCSRFKNISTSENGRIITSGGTMDCDEGWVFRENEISTAITEYEMVCDHSQWRPIIMSLFMAGEAIGSLFGGILSDRFGRRPLLVWGKMIEFLLYFIIGFSPDLTFYVILMTICGAFAYLPYTTAFVLGNELVGPAYRNIISFCVYGGYCTGAAVVPLIGYLFGDWKWLMRFIGLFGVLYIPFYWVILESPYWLLSAGKIDEAKEVLRKIAKINKRPFREESLDKSFLLEENIPMMKSKQDTEKPHQLGLLGLLRSSVMRTRLLLVYVSWIVTNMVYYGLALNVTALSGDRFWNAAISGLLEFPGIIGGFLIIQWIGRPLSLSTLMGIGGIFLAMAPFIEEANPIAMTVLVITGKTALIGAFYINFSITGEMSPTLYRNVAVGSSSAVGKIGSFTAPYLMYLGDTTSKFVPFLVMGGLALISAVMSGVVLPETKGIVLPDTIQDAKRLQPRWKGLCKKKVLPETTHATSKV